MKELILGCISILNIALFLGFKCYYVNFSISAMLYDNQNDTYLDMKLDFYSWKFVVVYVPAHDHCVWNKFP